MKALGRFLIGFMRRLGCGKATEVMPNLVGSNRRLVGVVLYPRVVSDALKSGLVFARAVGTVLTIGSLTKIFPSVVGTLAVAMVDLIFRPFAGHVEPRQTMDSILLSSYLAGPISLVVKVANFITNTDLRSRLDPKHLTGFRIVPNQFQQFRMGDFCHAGALAGIAGTRKD